MAQQLRELVALAEDWGSRPITHVAGDKLFVTPGTGEPRPSSVPSLTGTACPGA